MKASDDKLKNACHFALNVLKAPGAQKNSIVLELCDSSPPGHVKEAKAANKAVQRLLGKKNGDDTELDTLIGIWLSNSHSMLATGEAGIFPLTAMLNHSCDPNCVFSADPDGTIYVAVTEDVEQGDQLCVAYIEMDDDEPVDQRRERLQESFHFVCQCLKCEFQSEAEAAEAKASAASRPRKKPRRRE